MAPANERDGNGEGEKRASYKRTVPYCTGSNRREQGSGCDIEVQEVNGQHFWLVRKKQSLGRKGGDGKSDEGYDRREECGETHPKELAAK